MLPSTQAAGGAWEIFLTQPNGVRQQVDELGTFGTLVAARAEAALLRRMLGGDDRSSDVLLWVHSGRKHKDAKVLLNLRRQFFRKGIDPRRVTVEVEPYGAVQFTPARFDAGDEDADPDDTPLVPSVPFSNCLEV